MIPHTNTVLHSRKVWGWKGWDGTW